MHVLSLVAIASAENCNLSINQDILYEFSLPGASTNESIGDKYKGYTIFIYVVHISRLELQYHIIKLTSGQRLGMGAPEEEDVRGRHSGNERLMIICLFSLLVFSPLSII